VKERQTEITIETWEVLISRHPSSLHRLWCAHCQKPVLIISWREASLCGLSLDAAHSLAQAGRLHFIETAGELPQICLNSLLQI